MELWCPGFYGFLKKKREKLKSVKYYVVHKSNNAKCQYFLNNDMLVIWLSLHHGINILNGENGTLFICKRKQKPIEIILKNLCLDSFHTMKGNYRLTMEPKKYK